MPQSQVQKISIYLKHLTFSSFMRPSNWTISSLRLSWRADILCSSSSLRCLRKKQLSSETAVNSLTESHVPIFWDQRTTRKKASLGLWHGYQAGKCQMSQQLQLEVYINLLEVILKQILLDTSHSTMNQPFNEIFSECFLCHGPVWCFGFPWDNKRKLNYH